MVLKQTIILGRREAANPESIVSGCGYGFRVPSLCSVPGMTAERLARFNRKPR
jgi:hypothetical protein